MCSLKTSTAWGDAISLYSLSFLKYHLLVEIGSQPTKAENRFTTSSYLSHYDTKLYSVTYFLQVFLRHFCIWSLFSLAVPNGSQPFLYRYTCKFTIPILRGTVLVSGVTTKIAFSSSKTIQGIAESGDANQNLILISTFMKFRCN